MPLGKFVWKIKRKNEHLLPFLVFGPRAIPWQPPAQLPSPLSAPAQLASPFSSLGPAPAASRAPRSAQQAALAQLDARNRRRIILAPAAADRPGPRVSAIPFLRAARQPSTPGAAATAAHDWRRGSVPLRSSASINRSRTPSRAPPATSAPISLLLSTRKPQPTHGEAPKTAVRRPP